MKQFFRFLFTLIFLGCFSFIQAQQRFSPNDYINRYKDDAIKDMQRTGVPASITLAQGILESESGNSDLAQIANNHFGIKCHNEWSGPTFHKDDDAKNECFRKYGTALESFDDHSYFLRSRDRYAFLFDYDIKDFKNWAHGLKSAGYATNPRYAHQLIKLIEDYNLAQFDENGKNIPISKPAENTSPVIASKDKNAVIEEVIKPTVKNPEPIISPTIFADRNNVKYIISKRNDSWLSIAKENEMMLWQVLKYNDVDKSDPLTEGTIVYIKPKRASASQDYHVVKSGDTMWSISQLYAVKLQKLYKKNLMEPGSQPEVGAKIWLKETKPGA